MPNPAITTTGTRLEELLKLKEPSYLNITTLLGELRYDRWQPEERVALQNLLTRFLDANPFTHSLKINPEDFGDPFRLNALTQSVEQSFVLQTPPPASDNSPQNLAPPTPNHQPPTTKTLQVNKYLDQYKETVKQIQAINELGIAAGNQAYQTYLQGLSPKEIAYLKPHVAAIFNNQNFLKILQQGMRAYGLDSISLSQYIAQELSKEAGAIKTNIAHRVLSQAKPNSIEKSIQQSLEETLNNLPTATRETVATAISPSSQYHELTTLEANLRDIYRPNQNVQMTLREAVTTSSATEAIALLKDARAITPTNTSSGKAIAQEINAALTAMQNQDSTKARQHMDSATTLSDAHSQDSYPKELLKEALSQANIDPVSIEALENQLIERSLGFNATSDPTTLLKESAAELKLNNAATNALLANPNTIEATALISTETHRSALESNLSPHTVKTIAANLNPDEINQLNHFLSEKFHLNTDGFTPTDTLNQAFNAITQTMSKEDILRLGQLTDHDFGKLATELPRFIEYLNSQDRGLPTLPQNLLQDPKALNTYLQQFLSSNSKHPFITFAETHLQPYLSSASTSTKSFSSFITSIRQFFSGGLKGFLSNTGSFLNSTIGSAAKWLGSGLGNMGSALGGGLRSLLSGLGSTASGLGSATVTSAATAGTGLATLSAPAWLPGAAVAISLAAIFAVVFFVIPPSSSQLQSTGKTTGGGLVEINPYASLIKTADPTNLEDPTGRIAYTYSITQKLGALTNVKLISDEVRVFKEKSSTPFTLDAPAPPESIDSSWTSEEYYFSLDNSMDDALIINTVTIEFTPPDGSPTQTVRGTVTTIIGNPPTGCFVTANPPAPNPEVRAIAWPPNESAREMVAAATIIANFSNPDTLCGGGSINLYLAQSGVSVNYGGWYLGARNVALDFKNGTLGQDTNVLYTLAHETGHVYAQNVGYQGFYSANNQMAYWNGATCVNNIYPIFTPTNEGTCYSENFAEAFARYIIPAAKGPLPPHWQTWFANNVFNR